MVKFKVVNSFSEIKLNNEWVNSPNFKSKDRIVTSKYQGRQFRLIAKKERELSTLERFGRGFFGLVSVVSTLGLALASKHVRALFTETKKKIRFAIEYKGCESGKKLNDSTTLDYPQKINTILQKVSASLRSSMEKHKVGEYRSLNVVLIINGKEFNFSAKGDQKGLDAVDSLLDIKSSGKEMVLNIINQFHEKNTEIKWTFSFTTEAGVHEFKYYLKNEQGLTIANGALFGEPGHTFVSSNLDIDSLNELTF